MEQKDQYSKLFCKGFWSVENEMIKDENVSVAAAYGFAIFDAQDSVVFKVNKKLVYGNGKDTSKLRAEAEGLVAGFNAALDLGIKRLTFFCHDRNLYRYVKGDLQPKTRKIILLVIQLIRLQDKFEYCQPSLVARCNAKFASKLAFDALLSQRTLPAETSGAKNLKETCSICFGDTDVSQMFLVDTCLHNYCFCCMKRHVEVQLLHGIVVKCPHERCNSEIDIESYGKLLETALIEMVRERIKEATIPATEKVYCPHPRCSALMSKSDVLESENKLLAKSGARNCTKCLRRFCINCRVPWHTEMICSEYKRSASYLLDDEGKLNSLAKEKLWRQCVHCNHMVELAEGCYHIICRCGYEFCYTCGAEYEKKKKTCSCPLWDERFIAREVIAP